MIRIIATILLWCAASVAAITSGGLSFAPWTQRYGVVDHGSEAPPGPWAFFAAHGTPSPTTVASIPEESVFISAGSVAGQVIARNADTGAPLWEFNDGSAESSPYAFIAVLPLSPSGAGASTFAAVAAFQSGGLFALDTHTGALLSNLTLPAAVATSADSLSSGTPDASPLAPYQAYLAATANGTAVPMITVVSKDRSSVFVVLSSGDGRQLRLVASVSCGAPGCVRSVVPRGALSIVVQFPSAIVEVDAATNATRTIAAAVAAVTSVQHSATAAHGSPTVASARTGALQPVYYAGYSSFRRSVVVGTLDFDAGTISECAALRTAHSDVKAIRIVAENTTESSAPSPRAILVQTATSLEAITVTPHCGRWPLSWRSSYAALIHTLVERQSLPPTTSMQHPGEVVLLPSAGSSVGVHLAAFRIGAAFFIVDVVAGSVVWATASSTESMCYPDADPSVVNPTLAAVGPSLDRLVVGCPNAYYVIHIVDINEYVAHPNSYTTGAVPPFSTQTGRQTPQPGLIAAPLLFESTLITARTDSVVASFAAGSTHRVAASFASATLNGAVFTMNAKTSADDTAVVTAVGSAGQDIWRRDFALPGTTDQAVLQPFGPYLLVATESWKLHVLNATSGAFVESLSVPFECSAGQGNDFGTLQFEAFVLVAQQFGRSHTTGLPVDPSMARALFFSFGVCEFYLRPTLQLLQINHGQGRSTHPTRMQLSASLVASVSAAGAVRMSSVENTTHPQLLWEVLPPGLSLLGNPVVSPVLRLSGDVIAIATDLAVAAVLASTGTTLWVDTHTDLAGGGNYFDQRSLAVYGDTIVVASAEGVVGYHIAAMAVNESVPQSTQTGHVTTGTSPQQVKWRRFSDEFSSHGFGTGSLTPYGRYIVNGGSWIVALDPRTGETVWRTNLPLPTWLSTASSFYVPLSSRVSVVENIVTAVVVNPTGFQALLQLEESTGAPLQSLVSDVVTESVFTGDRIYFSQSPSPWQTTPGSFYPLVVASWPAMVNDRAVLPAAPRPPLAPTTTIMVSPTYERPTYAPLTPPLPPLAVDVNASMPPPLRWILPSTLRVPSAGVSVAASALIRLVAGSTLSVEARSLSDRALLWSVALGAAEPVGLSVSDSVSVVVVTCLRFISGLNVSTGATLWTTPFKPNGVVRNPAVVFPPDEARGRGVVLVVAHTNMAFTYAYGFDPLTGHEVWASDISCSVEAPSFSLSRGLTGPSNAASFGESSHSLPANVLLCEDRHHAIIDPAFGRAEVLGRVVVASGRRSIIASLSDNGTARLINARTGATTSQGPLVPPLGYTSRHGVPQGVGFVAFDRRRNTSVVLAATTNDDSIVAYAFNSSSGVFEELWNVSVTAIGRATGMPVLESGLSFCAGTAQPMREEEMGTVLGLLSAEIGDFSLLFRASHGHYFVLTSTLSAQVDVVTLQHRFVDTQFYFSTGVVIPAPWLVGAGSLALIADAEQPSTAGGTGIAQWALAGQVLAVRAAKTIVVGSTDDGTGDLFTVTAEPNPNSGNTDQFLARRGAVGASAGALRWAVPLPANQGQALELTISQTAVMAFAVEGVFFYDLVSGNVTTSVPVEVLQTRCPVSTLSWLAFTLDSVTTWSRVAHFARPASPRAVFLGISGACVFMFNTRREMAVYRVPYFSSDAILNAFSLYAPPDASPSVVSVSAGIVEKWTLPADFLAGGQPGPASYRSAPMATRAWVTSLETEGNPAMAATFVASDTFFVSDYSVTAAVDLRSGTLLWRTTSALTTNTLTLRVYDGHLFMLTSDCLVVLDAFALAPPRRVIKTFPLAASYGAALPMSELIGGRVVAAPSGAGLIGVDTVTLDVLWNVTVPQGPNGVGTASWVRPVPAPRGSPLFGAFAAVPYESSAPVGVFNGATGAEIASVHITRSAQQLVLVDVACTSAGPHQRCSVIAVAQHESDPETTVVALLPETAAIEFPLPAPGPAPTSPPVPPGYRYQLPPPKNGPPAPVSADYGAIAPSALTPELLVADIAFAASGLVVSVTTAEAAALNATTGATVWRVPFNATLQSYCIRPVTMAAGSPFLIVVWGCRPEPGLATIIFDVTTGSRLLDTVAPFATPLVRSVSALGAVLGRTACHMYSHDGLESNGIVCYNVDDGRHASYACPAPLMATDVRPNPSDTALVLSCQGAYVAGLNASLSVLWSLGPDPSPQTVTVVPADPAAAHIPVAMTAAASHDGMATLSLRDTDTEALHKWVGNASALLGGEAIAAATPLTVHLVALQSATHEVILDLDRGVVLSKTYAAVCGPCSRLRLLDDMDTVISVNAPRGTVVSYSLSRRSTNWETHAFLTADNGQSFVVTRDPVVKGSRGIAVGNGNLYLLLLSSGKMIWSGPTSPPIATTAACVWTNKACYAYVPPPTVVTPLSAFAALPVSNGVLVLDGSSIYTLDLPASPAALPSVPRHATPRSDGYTGGVLFGGPRGDRFLVSMVDNRYWVFDTAANLSAVHAFNFPLDNEDLDTPRSQTARLKNAVAVPEEHGGALFLPGTTSGVLALTASTTGVRVSFTTAFWQSEQPADAPLTVYRQRRRATAGVAQHRTCGVVVPLGGGVAVLDCVRVTPWWSSPQPPTSNKLSAVVSGDYVLYSTSDRVVYASVITGQTVWRSTPLEIASQSLYVWNHTAYVGVITNSNYQTAALLALDLAFNPSMPAEMDKVPTVLVPGFDDSSEFIMSPGFMVVPNDTAIAAYSLTDGRCAWTKPRSPSQNLQQDIYSVVDGTLLLTTSGVLLAIDILTGSSQTIATVGYVDTNIATPLRGVPYVAVATSNGQVQLLRYPVLPPLPQSQRGPAYGLPPVSYPPASPSSLPAPTLAPGAVLPSLGCVSRVVGASEDFVSCINHVTATAYAVSELDATTGRVVFTTCPAIARSLKDCGVSYLRKMGLRCPVGAAHVHGLFARLNYTALFGVCPSNGGGGQCTVPSDAAELCDAMKARTLVPGVGVLAPGQHAATGFSFPPPPPFAEPLTPRPETPAPSDAPSLPTAAPAAPVGPLWTAFALQYPSGTPAPDASALSTRLSVYLGLDVTVELIAAEPLLRSQHWVAFNVTSSNAQLVARALSRRPEASNARALGGLQLGPYVPAPVGTSAPPKTAVEPLYIAGAAVAAAVVAAVAAAVVMWAVMRRRSARAVDDSVEVGVLSQRELKSLQDGMLSAESPYRDV